MEKYTKILVEEHKNILKVVELIEQEIDKLKSDQEINNDFWEHAISFIQNYADKFHHAKEEDFLFKEMTQDSVELHCNPIEQMLSEHDSGRNYVKGLKEGFSESDKSKIIDNAEQYCVLLKEHIFKEDNILYPMAEQFLDQLVKTKLHKQFINIEKENFSRDEIKKYLSILE